MGGWGAVELRKRAGVPPRAGERRLGDRDAGPALWGRGGGGGTEVGVRRSARRKGHIGVKLDIQYFYRGLTGKEMQGIAVKRVHRPRAAGTAGESYRLILGVTRNDADMIPVPQIID